MGGRRIGLLAAFILMFATTAFAQQTSGNVQGRIIDEQKNPVPGVTVTAMNPATGFSRVVQTDGEGVYRFTALPVGTYSLKV